MSIFLTTRVKTTGSIRACPRPTVSVCAFRFQLRCQASRERSREPLIGLATPIPEDVSPPVTKAIVKVMESKEVGMQRCSVCTKQFLVPRAQWIEYHYLEASGVKCSPADMFQPFMRRACSWVCVDRLAMAREEDWQECERRVIESTSSIRTGDI